MKRQRPLKQIRAYCLYCMNGNSNEIKICASKTCALFYCRFGKNKSNPKLPVLKIIKSYCADCSDGKLKIKYCDHEECQLYQFKNGKNPFSQIKGNPGSLKPFAKKAILSETPVNTEGF